MTATFEVRAIGRVVSERDTAIDDDWDDVVTAIDLDTAQFTNAALWGLADFSHAEILFLFDRVPDHKIETGARHPRGRTDWPQVGIFAQRGKNRPNRIGATICRIKSVSGLRINVEGLDAIHGTPVLDIKPVMSGFERRGELLEPDWAKMIMESYWVSETDK